MKLNYQNILKSSYMHLKDISDNIKKKFSLKLIVKGSKSEFDSIDIVNFFSILEKELKKNKAKSPNFLDEKFFFKFQNISFSKLIEQIRKINEK
tara:strand:+ start:2497 stop:2778 length:282 start_codon:yes stop_codon:yes gene_type:complete